MGSIPTGRIQEKIHFSLDLDFFNSFLNNGKLDIERIKCLSARLEIAINNFHIPFKVFTEHQEVVPYVLEDVTTIINMDSHSDLVDSICLSEDGKPADFNWVNYVSERLKNPLRYVWLKPKKHAVFCHDEENPFRVKKSHKWKECKIMNDPYHQFFDWSNVVNFSIVLSPSYTDRSIFGVLCSNGFLKESYFDAISPWFHKWRN